jgi:1,2-diacylglycerol 3-beta-galactosyltransferase
MAKRIVFLMSDTGGGHRAAAEAIRDALYIRYGKDNVEATLIDVFRLSRFPMNYMPEFYPWLVNRSKASWAIGYNLSNTRGRANLLARTMYYTNARRFKKMIQTNPADVVVCVHSVITRAAMRAYDVLDMRPPFITVVTDLVTTHYFWYDKQAERCLVPTQAAYDRGLKAGLKPEQMRITGLPVDPRFMDSLVSKQAARAELGWLPDKPAILMVAGGDGMGPLHATARAISEKHLDCQLAIIAGRNRALKEKLEQTPWEQPTHIYGFVRNMPRLMAAADILVTKAGPATLTEAAIAGLPMIISDAIPGQEDGNVTYVVENNAGAYAPEPRQVAETVANWLHEGADALAQRAANARRIANPNAVWEIADEIWQWAHHESLPGKRRRRRLHRHREKSS